ncbi:MAG: hypothetical protein OH319_02840 [Candidatus Parvarchaeota archaeon]|nr:hypothetical protein [Candidatus Jingweiarchaeum tengchongense]MCW1298304.1 hypothetical protein [Candidatus Jingweiarchaeum tengchongense]MCW1300395.1 hypothetical protein [Candidatus Jingweiarchaeum tengchongense]MCW1304760.1 hypothetical protein [Candidatus Jingweiarchaeum tengchongense]MCW1305350.1 hypothetical protein [Candidatus Jingweiarchaeum tengchongense]
MLKRIFGEKISKDYNILDVKTICGSENRIWPSTTQDPLSTPTITNPLISNYQIIFCAGELTLEDTETKEKLSAIFSKTNIIPYVGLKPSKEDEELIKKLERKVEEMREGCAQLVGKCILISGKIKKTKGKKVIVINNIDEILGHQ